MILVCGGIVGYARKGSSTSLAGGLGAGFLVILAGYLSLQAFHKRKNSYFALILETGAYYNTLRFHYLAKTSLKWWETFVV